jgi:hypothetical protein
MTSRADVGTLAMRERQPTLAHAAREGRFGRHTPFTRGLRITSPRPRSSR